MRKNNMRTPEEKEKDDYKHKYGVKLLCEYMSISRSEYYKWKKPDDEHEMFSNLVWNGWKYLYIQHLQH